MNPKAETKRSWMPNNGTYGCYILEVDGDRTVYGCMDRLNSKLIDLEGEGRKGVVYEAFAFTAEELGRYECQRCAKTDAELKSAKELAKRVIARWGYEWTDEKDLARAVLHLEAENERLNKLRKAHEWELGDYAKTVTRLNALLAEFDAGAKGEG